jgi:hypothetical protein
MPVPGMIGAALLYAIVYIAILLAAATLIFNQRNFK